MSEKAEKAKEILRQGELRIHGIIDFSNDLDNKIFKVLGFAITIISGLIFFVLKSNFILNSKISVQKLNSVLPYTCIFSIILLCITIFLLLLAGKPKNYKGVGVPLTDFDNNNTLHDILNNTVKKRYIARFEHNKNLNAKKGKHFNRAMILLSCLPIMTMLFHYTLPFANKLFPNIQLILYAFLCPIIVIIITFLFILTTKKVRQFISK